MMFYKTTGNQPDDKEVTLWAGSQAEASKNRVSLKGIKCTNVGTDSIDVPTNKVDLLAWLNKVCV